MQQQRYARSSSPGIGGDIAFPSPPRPGLCLPPISFLPRPGGGGGGGGGRGRLSDEFYSRANKIVNRGAVAFGDRPAVLVRGRIN
jgi:hypothetical protein